MLRMANREVQTPMANTKATKRLSQEPVSIFKRPLATVMMALLKIT